MEAVAVVWIALPLFLVFLPGTRRTHKAFGFLYFLGTGFLLVVILVTGEL